MISIFKIKGTGVMGLLTHVLRKKEGNKFFSIFKLKKQTYSLVLKNL